MIFELSELIRFFAHSYGETIVEEIFSVMQCQRCGQCCKLPIQVFFEDIDDISVFLGMSSDDFTKEYVDRKPDEGYYLKTPCPFFQEGNNCRIHQVKPEKCKLFPFNLTLGLPPLLQGIDWCPLAGEISKYVRIGGKISDLPDMWRKNVEEIEDKANLSMETAQRSIIVGSLEDVLINIKRKDHRLEK